MCLRTISYWVTGRIILCTVYESRIVKYVSSIEYNKSAQGYIFNRFDQIKIILTYRSSSSKFSYAQANLKHKIAATSLSSALKDPRVQ